MEPLAGRGCPGPRPRPRFARGRRRDSGPRFAAFARAPGGTRTGTLKFPVPRARRRAVLDLPESGTRLRPRFAEDGDAPPLPVLIASGGLRPGPSWNRAGRALYQTVSSNLTQTYGARSAWHHDLRMSRVRVVPVCRFGFLANRTFTGQCGSRAAPRRQPSTGPSQWGSRAARPWPWRSRGSSWSISGLRGRWP